MVTMSITARVLLVDDDDFTRVTLASTLRSLGCTVVADSATVTDAMAAADSTKPDLALLDLDLGEGPTGVDLAYGLRRLLPSIALVMLSSYEEPRLIGYGIRPLPEGTQYVVKKDVSDPEVLARAIRLALSPTVHTFATRIATQRDETLDALSDAQVEIMRLIAAGYGNAEIARRMQLTEDGVNKAVTRLIRQLDLHVGAGRNARVLITQAYAEFTGRAIPRHD